MAADNPTIEEALKMAREQRDSYKVDHDRMKTGIAEAVDILRGDFASRDDVVNTLIGTL